MQSTASGSLIGWPCSTKIYDMSCYSYLCWLSTETKPSRQRQLISSIRATSVTSYPMSDLLILPYCSWLLRVNRTQLVLVFTTQLKLVRSLSVNLMFQLLMMSVISTNNSFLIPDFFHRLEVSTNGYKLLLTDLVRLYVEELRGEGKILQRCEHLNPGEVTVLNLAPRTKSCVVPSIFHCHVDRPLLS